MAKKQKASASGTSSKRGGRSAVNVPSSLKNPVGKKKTKKSTVDSSTGSKALVAGGSKKKRTPKAEAPFPLYQDVAKADTSEGFESIVNLLRGRKNIVVLVGAGISVSCGIPDFRSKGSGLYSTLDHQELGLSCPEELFDWEVFKEDPRPFFKFARNLYFPLGSDDNAKRVKPSDSHKLLALLEQKNMLLRVYSQNIDGLEQVAGVSNKKMVYAHGSLQWATCCKCKNRVTAKEIEPSILKRSVPLCQEPSRSSNRDNASKKNALYASQQQQPARAKKRPRVATDEFMPMQEEGKPSTCNGVLKPGVTFFGEALSDNVTKSLECDRKKIDALIVIGTSLSVAPMSKVIGYMPANIPRILINRNIVHPKIGKTEADEGGDSDDEDREFREGYVFDGYLLGFCDDVTRTLAKKLFADETAGTNTPTPEKDQMKRMHCQLLATVRNRSDSRQESKEEEDDDEGIDESDDDNSMMLEPHKKEDWSFCTIPSERVVLFPGAEPTRGSGYGDDGVEDDNSDVTFREIAHCDGCTKRIVGTIHKCVECFDYDLCQKCFPKLSKTHHDGEHQFAAEPAASVEP